MVVGGGGGFRCITEFSLAEAEAVTIVCMDKKSFEFVDKMWMNASTFFSFDNLFFIFKNILES